MKYEITAKRIQQALSNMNMKPQELADKSGVSKSSISQYVNGSHAPSNISSGKMAPVLNVDPLWLMGFDVHMAQNSDYLYTDGNSDFLIEVTKNASNEEFVTRIKKYMELSTSDRKSIDDMIDFLYAKKLQGED